jgi:hypothetical protein
VAQPGPAASQLGVDLGQLPAFEHRIAYAHEINGKRGESPGRKAAGPNLKSRRVAGLPLFRYVRADISATVSPDLRQSQALETDSFCPHEAKSIRRIAGQEADFVQLWKKLS